MVHRHVGLRDRHSLPVGVHVVPLPPEPAGQLLPLHPYLPVHHLLLVLVVSTLHLGGGVAATRIRLYPPMPTSVVRCPHPQLAILHHHLGLIVGVPLTRILVPGGHCEDGGPILLRVKYG